MSVKSHLTSGVYVCPENTVESICTVGHFLRKSAHAHYFNSAIAHAFSRVHARVALRVLHFSAFIHFHEF